MTSAAVVSFPTVGGVISKSLGRIAGSLLGAIAALLLPDIRSMSRGFFYQHVGVARLFVPGLRALPNNVAYAFQLAGYTAAIIAFPMVNLTEAQPAVGYRSGACLRGDSRYFVRRHDDDDPAEQFRCYSPFNRIEKNARPITGTCQFTLAA
ncbi:FUSC family protein [Shigella sonnei]